MKKQDSLSTYELHEMFPDEASAVAHFESIRWSKGRYCRHCRSENTVECKMPKLYRCRECRKHFSCMNGIQSCSPASSPLKSGSTQRT